MGTGVVNLDVNAGTVLCFILAAFVVLWLVRTKGGRYVLAAILVVLALVILFQGFLSLGG